MPKEGEENGDKAPESSETHIILPPEKENRRIRFQEEILVTEIENRFYFNEYPEDDDEGSYEIEIVDDDGDADFYLEIVDGEVFYVFETEDDISLESEEGGEEAVDRVRKDKQVSEDDITSQLNASMFINVDDMMFAPDLDESEGGAKDDGPPMEISLDAATMESFNQGSQFLELDNLFESSDEEKEDSSLKMDSYIVLEPEEPEPATKNSRTESEETLIVMEDEVEAQPGYEKSLKKRAPEYINVLEPTLSNKNIANGLAEEEVSKPVVAESPEPSSPTNKSCPVESTVSPGSSPSRTKSILKCNPASPIKTPRKERSKKKTTKTFSKTYVRADQLDGEHRVYSWAKPDWTKERKLRQTGRADLLRKGKLEAPITFFPKKPVNEGLQEDENVEDLVKKAMSNSPKSVSIFGTRKSLKISVNGSKLRKGQDIVKPITQATVLRTPENINKVANPGKLRPTQTGEVVRKGGTLAAPVTFPNKKEDCTNAVANKNVLRNKGLAPQPRKQYKWSKPDWTKESKLRQSAVGEAVKKGADLQGPITQAPHRPNRKKSFDNQSFSSSGSSEGAKSDEAVIFPRRGGRRHVSSRTTSMPSSSRSQANPSSGLSTHSCVSKDSNDLPGVDPHQQETLRKRIEQEERQARLARMARQWAEEDH